MGGVGVDALPNCCYDYRHEEQKIKIVETCMDCGEFILEGDNYYDIKKMVFCERCMRGYLKTGE